ncbi:DUF2254 domain-containing protein [Nakamurella multipartita]|uniref:DUF2254 domain-containing protein n=1 Tax=Nakamurella multipartita (strain ATCC 700099 / DSM 44233 / CIP 104796 / JCM 9543 / NBRC 105858 / Y-104) TaxID=479431 RepID=C8XEU6_NAKMY|nr:DUF2254 domain-containing protein [Nakamurella multipartita]ACV79847.1 hypothetical protein Namu_3522 [Nakamurella multipartita DSM 44233]
MRAGRRGSWSVLRDAVRTQLWPFPALAITIAVIAGVLLPRLDAQIDDQLPPQITYYLFGGGADAARAVLAGIAGSLITVTSLTFSLTVVTLQLASSQFSPRLLRTFSSDRFVQLTLGLFLGTFAYALTVLRTVRTAADDQALFVPQIAVTVAFVLAVASVFALVIFLAHLAREIRVETMLATVHGDATTTLRRVLPEHDPDRTPVAGPDIPADAEMVPAPSSGFLVWLDEPGLLRAAVQADAIVTITEQPGSSLIEGVPAGACWPRGGGRFEPDVLRTLRERVAPTIHTGPERTAAQDAAFGLRQLADVTVKALSPGINDPTTAIHALGHLSALLGELAARDLGPHVLTDDGGQLRVVLARPTFAELLELAVAPTRRYGAADPDVLARLFQLLREIAWTAPDAEHHRAIAGQLERLRTTAQAQSFDPTERAYLSRLADQVDQTLDGRWVLRT